MSQFAFLATEFPDIHDLAARAAASGRYAKAFRADQRRSFSGRAHSQRVALIYESRRFLDSFHKGRVFQKVTRRRRQGGVGELIASLAEPGCFDEARSNLSHRRRTSTLIARFA